MRTSYGMDLDVRDDTKNMDARTRSSEGCGASAISMRAMFTAKFDLWIADRLERMALSAPLAAENEIPRR